MYLFDTNVVSEIRKVASGRADEGLSLWVSRIEPTLAYISVATVMELEIGVMLAEHRDPRSGAVLRVWLEEDVRAAFEGRVLPVDVEVASIAAGLHVPDPAPVNDAYIAATALAGALSVVTRNTGDFNRFSGLDVINPWTATNTGNPDTS